MLYGKKYKTKVIEQSINPEWDYEFEIPMHSSKLPALFCITVWDKDTFGRDFLGEVTIPFKNIFDRNAGGVSDGVPRHYKDPDNRSSWYGLSKRSEKNNVSGDIQIKFGFMEDHVRDNHQYITAWQSLTS
ncbi:C2 domain-containing protein [Spinellus fusiger]|nr:C2 domain-containing protein [Spinellus fusiger]